MPLGQGLIKKYGKKGHSSLGTGESDFGQQVRSLAQSIEREFQGDSKREMRGYLAGFSFFRSLDTQN